MTERCVLFPCRYRRVLASLPCGSEVVEGSAEKEVVVVKRGVVVEGFVPGSGAVGSGQVMSLDSSGKNSLILL